MAALSYDLCVVGAGPGGFSAATRAARRGARVCLVEAGRMGGTCLNSGCIPARAIGTTAWMASLLKRGQEMGIEVEGLRTVWSKVVARKERIIGQLRDGLTQLASRRKIHVVMGEAAWEGGNRVTVRTGEGSCPVSVEAGRLIVATGSKPCPLPSAPFDGRRVLSSDDVLCLPELPGRIAIVGGGVVGCEFASYLAPLGVAVTILEGQDQLLPGGDREVARALAAIFRRAGIRVCTEASVERIAVSPAGVEVWSQGAGPLSVDQVLVTVGRRPNTTGFGWEAAGVLLAPSGAVPVDCRLETPSPGVFAVGDILGQHQTAYTAAYEGAVAAENALGAQEAVDYAPIPDCIFTIPEVASVGLTEERCQEQGIPAAASRVPWSASGRAMTLEETEGFLKVVYDTRTQRVLGVHLLGPRSTDLIGEAALALRCGFTLPQMARMIHGHPTLAEAFSEACARPFGEALYVA